MAEDRSGYVTMGILERTDSSIGELPVAELVVVAAWYMWWQRRQFVRGESIQSPERTVVTLKGLATIFLRASTPKQPKRKYEQLEGQTIIIIPKLTYA